MLMLWQAGHLSANLPSRYDAAQKHEPHTIKFTLFEILPILGRFLMVWDTVEVLGFCSFLASGVALNYNHVSSSANNAMNIFDALSNDFAAA